MTRRPLKVTQADEAPKFGDTFVYFIRAGEYVKIGQSKNWRGRLAQMQTGSPYTIVPLLVLIGEAGLEKQLHSRFRQSHFRGEWYHLSEAIRAFIKEHLPRCATKSEISDLRNIAPPWTEKHEVVL